MIERDGDDILWPDAARTATCEQRAGCRTTSVQPSPTRWRPDHAGLTITARAVAVPMRAIADGIAGGFGLGVPPVGGTGAMAANRDMCRARGIPHTCDDAWGGDIVAATGVHLAATVEPALLVGVWIAAPHIAAHLDPVHPITGSAGRIAIPPARASASSRISRPGGPRRQLRVIALAIGGR